MPTRRKEQPSSFTAPTGASVTSSSCSNTTASTGRPMPRDPDFYDSRNTSASMTDDESSSHQDADPRVQQNVLLVEAEEKVAANNMTTPASTAVTTSSTGSSLLVATGIIPRNAQQLPQYEETKEEIRQSATPSTVLFRTTSSSGDANKVSGLATNVPTLQSDAASVVSASDSVSTASNMYKGPCNVDKYVEHYQQHAIRSRTIFQRQQETEHTIDHTPPQQSTVSTEQDLLSQKQQFFEPNGGSADGGAALLQQFEDELLQKQHLANHGAPTDSSRLQQLEHQLLEMQEHHYDSYNETTVQSERRPRRRRRSPSPPPRPPLGRSELSSLEEQLRHKRAIAGPPPPMYEEENASQSRGEAAMRDLEHAITEKFGPAAAAGRPVDHDEGHYQMFPARVKQDDAQQQQQRNRAGSLPVLNEQSVLDELNALNDPTRRRAAIQDMERPRRATFVRPGAYHQAPGQVAVRRTQTATAATLQVGISVNHNSNHATMMTDDTEVSSLAVPGEDDLHFQHRRRTSRANPDVSSSISTTPLGGEHFPDVIAVPTQVAQEGSIYGRIARRRKFLAPGQTTNRQQQATRSDSTGSASDDEVNVDDVDVPYNSSNRHDDVTGDLEIYEDEESALDIVSEAGYSAAAFSINAAASVALSSAVASGASLSGSNGDDGSASSTTEGWRGVQVLRGQEDDRRRRSAEVLPTSSTTPEAAPMTPSVRRIHQFILNESMDNVAASGLVEARPVGSATAFDQGDDIIPPNSAIATANPLDENLQARNRARRKRQGKRWSLWASLLFFVLAVSVIVFTVAMVSRNRGDAEDPNNPAQIPTIAPTTERSWLVQEQIYSELGARLGPQLNDDLWQDETSPHYKALKWIVDEDIMQLGPSDSHLFQRYLMAYFYFHTSEGGPWTTCNPAQGRETQFCTYRYVSPLVDDQYKESPWHIRWLSNQDECTWAGVYCNDDQLINEISLNGYKMSGKFPEDLALLDNLTLLSLRDNSFSGTLPSQLSVFPQLRRLRLSKNRFTGTIAEEWQTMTDLTLLDIASNSLTGTLSSELGLLTHLANLLVDNNKLYGTVPSELTSLTGLQNLFMGNNKLSGTLMTEFGRLTLLDYLDISNTNVEGTLPSELGLLTQLQDLSLQSTKLRGTIPTELYGLPQIFDIHISKCYMTGTISTLIGQLKTLQILDISSNELTGRLPSELGHLEQLQHVFVQNNPFLTGSIPSEMCENKGPNTLTQVVADCTPVSITGLPGIKCQDQCCTKCCDTETNVCKET